MSTYFPTVPVEFAQRRGITRSSEPTPPLVLVVDDEPVIAETLAAILNRSGYAALSALDGASALETARIMPPQMLIADVAMPGMDGFELAKEIRRTIPDCEIILFSGQATTLDLVERHRCLEYDFPTLIKPVHPTDLLARLHRCFDRERVV
jgi:CheY-like chemotaxis protein